MTTIKTVTLKDYRVSLTKMDINYFGGMYAVHIFCGEVFINEKLGLSLDAANEVYLNTQNEVGKYLSNQRMHKANY